MTSNAERREQVLLQMVAYLGGVVDATLDDENAVMRVCSQMGEDYARLDELRDETKVA